MSAADLVDRAADDVLVVYGSEPPAGRDLDLLVRGRTEKVLDELLRDAGYVSQGRTYARFDDGGVDVVDLTPSASWGLPAAAEDDLFAAAVPLPGRSRLCRPAPAHRLLIEARRLARAGGVLKNTSRARVTAVLAEEPRARHDAERMAPEWGLERSLACLLDTVEGLPVPSSRWREARGETAIHRAAADRVASLRRLLPGPRRGAVIALSGLDGSGKSGQAARLAETLDTLGFDTAVVWTRLGSGERLRRLGEPVKRLLRPLLGRAPSAPVPSRYAPHAAPVDHVRSSRERSRVLSFVWALVVVLDHLVAQRRGIRDHLRAGRVVVCDRWTLDSLVHLRYRYADSTSLGLHERLLRAFAPRPRMAFLLEVPGAVAYERKPDQYSREQLERQERLYGQAARELGIDVIDGTCAVPEIADTVGRRAWAAVAVSRRRAVLDRLRRRGGAA